MKKLTTFYFALLFCFSAIGQDCGQVISFTGTTTGPNGSGLYEHNYTVETQSQGGGWKNVVFTIKCNSVAFSIPTNPFPHCEFTPTAPDSCPYVFSFETNCPGPVTLDWTGYSSTGANSGCGNSSALCTGSSCPGASGLEQPPLPVQLSLFEGIYDAEKVKLNWTTSSELNNEKFIIERSADGRTYHSIGEIT